MKKNLGLMLPERRIGLTAHDFVQAFSGEQIWITSARKRDGIPAIPSRWLLRLEALMKAANAESLIALQGDVMAHALGLDMPGISSMRWPEPCPPLEKRPRKFSVTEVERLIAEPYAFYARRVLGLEPLKSPGPQGGYSERGTLIHDALALFVDRHPGPLGAEALEQLLKCGREIFANAGDEKEIHGFWWPQFERIAAWFIKAEATLRQNVIRQLTEKRGKINFSLNGIDYTLSARADRLDVLEDGTLRILDYKSGGVPEAAQVTRGEAPQLPLEAWIARQGGFIEAGAKVTSELYYIKFQGSAEPAGKLIMAPGMPDDMARQHYDGLCMLLADYQQLNQPYLPLVEDERYGDFDHLARYAEWLAELGLEEDGLWT